MADSGSSRSASQPLSGSPLAAAIRRFLVATPMRKEGQEIPYVSILGPTVDAVETVLAAARERLRLSKIPCETCGGNGEHFMEPQVFDRTARCPSCGGSGEVYSKALIEAVENASKGLYVGEASDILDAILVYMGTE